MEQGIRPWRPKLDPKARGAVGVDAAVLGARGGKSDLAVL